MTRKEFTARAWNYVLRRGKVRRVTLRLNRMSEDLLLLGPNDLNAQLVRKLELGKGLDQILVEHVRAAYAKNQRINTRAVLQRVYDSESTKTAGAIAFGTFLSLDGLQEAAYGYFTEAGIELSKKTATFEYFDAYLYVNPKQAKKEIDD
ncbi:MAG: hypothetical protein F2544_04560, partial [Actinobacteria bacterium]|nr:hypothetical protein [Actinomycetota bacterium]